MKKIIENTNIWWEGLDNIIKILYCIAIPSTLVMLIQTVLSLCGFGDGMDVNISDTSALDFSATDVDIADLGNVPDSPVSTNYSGLKLITIQGVMTFFTIFSWCAIALIASGVPVAAGLVVGACAGSAAMYGAAALIKFLKSLTHDGTLNLSNAIGEAAEVYMPIPPKGEGSGKVTLHVQGRFMECSAVTNEHGTLKTGESVKVTGLQGEMLVVEAV
ncbi:MAG: hypothetical protein FWG90_07970 [Oscillospiraceae bacterium]|nr:hypothetical protein [Oscillospiraceae bacterium]